MGFLSILRKERQKQSEARVLVLGLDSAGKSTIVHRILGLDIDHVEPTFGFKIHTMNYQHLRVHLWDIGGQTSIRSYWRNYFESTDALVWVVDACDTWRLDICREELQRVLQEIRERIVLLVLANKCDLQGALDIAQIKRKFSGLEDYSGCYEIKCVSAKTNENIHQVKEWLLDALSKLKKPIF